MKNYLSKIKHLLPTFFAVSWGTVIGLALFRWLFYIQWPIIDIKEEFWNIWIPLFFPWIPITLWWRQRLRVLTFKGDDDKNRFFFQIICWVLLMVMLFISQSYLTTATGKLAAINTIDQINKVEKVRYYKLEEFAVLSSFLGLYPDIKATGKYNDQLNIDLYFVLPIVKDTSELIIQFPRNWYGLKFTKQISNRISVEEKEQAYQTFYAECLKKVKQYDFYDLDHFERKPNSDDRKNYLKAIASKFKEIPEKELVVLNPIKEKYEDRNGNKLTWIFASFGIGLGILLLILIWPGYSEKERKRFLAGKKPKEDDLVDTLSLLIPRGDHFATSILVNINILVFLMMLFSGVHLFYPNGEDLLQWGANRRTETLGGEWWRLLTSMFLHGGIMHLFLNISGMAVASILIEAVLGRSKYFAVYFLSGLCGSLASIWWYPHSISVGASGAIFGLYGAILGLLLTSSFPKNEKYFLIPIVGLFVVINLLWGIFGGVDNAAHIGGLLSGAFWGILLYKIDFGKFYSK